VRPWGAEGEGGAVEGCPAAAERALLLPPGVRPAPETGTGPACGPGRGPAGALPGPVVLGTPAGAAGFPT